MEQNELLRRTIEVLEEQQLVYMLVGSLASSVYGNPRMTNDIDIVVDLDLTQARTLCEGFPVADYYVSVSAAEQAVRQKGQFNVIHPASGNKIDFMVARQDAWGREQLSRRRIELILPDRPGFTASREDVILGKLWYYADGGSEKHLRDITGIVQESGANLDTAYIEQWAQTLGWDEIWRAALARLQSKPGL